MDWISEICWWSRAWQRLGRERVKNPPSAWTNQQAVGPEDRRNLRNELKGLPTEEIREILDSRRRDFGILAVNILHDLNMASMIRSHNAFLGSGFYYFGKRKYYKPGTVGAHHYEPVKYVKNLAGAVKTIPKDYTWVGIDNVEGAVPLHEFEWPEKPLLVFGSEAEGLDFCPEIRYHLSSIVEIPQIGSVRSLNVATAAGIVIYDLCLQQGWLHNQEGIRK